MKFDRARWGFQGDAEKPNLLYRLARRSPDVKWVLIGHNTADELDLPNVENPWLDARTRAAATPPRDTANPGHYWPPFETTWTSQPGWWVSEVSGFEDDLVELISHLDGVVLHVGQHAPTQLSIPNANRTWAEAFANPAYANRTYDSVKCYCRYLVRGLNALGDRTLGRAPVVWLCPDPRNYLKARDVKWPTGLDDVLAQYRFARRQKHERYGDARSLTELPTDLGVRELAYLRGGELWEVEHRYRHADLELMILPDDWEMWGRCGFNNRVPAGIATTSTKASVLGNNRRRSQLVRDYLLAAFPDAEVFGKWDAASVADLLDGTLRATTPAEFPDLLNRWRVTLALPIVESSWTVAKFWQCAAGNALCFLVEQVDDQGWLLPSRRPVDGTTEVGSVGETRFYSVRDDWTQAELGLAAWLRVETPAEFAARARYVVGEPALWRTLVDVQRRLLRRRWTDRLLERTIEERLGLS